jgi:hypothetical protein
MANRIQLRRGTSTEWTQFNPVLAEAELGVEIDTGRIKVGDGSTQWGNLKYERPLESVDATPNTLVLRDSTSSIKARNITLSSGGLLFGAAQSANQLSTARTIAASNTSDLSGQASFDGSSNIDINFLLREIFSGDTAITYTKFTVDAKGRVTTASNPTTLSGYGITDAQPLDSTLSAISGLTTLGIISRTTSSTVAVRTITGDTGEIDVTNGNGINGNPTIGLSDTTVTAGTYNDPSLTRTSGDASVNVTKLIIDAKGRITEAVDHPIALASETQLGIASFDAEDFDVASGVVTIALQGVDNDQLQNPLITFGSTQYTLGQTYTGFTTITELQVDIDTLYVDSANDRVGINTSSPASALEVVGSITTSARMTSTQAGLREIEGAGAPDGTQSESGLPPFQVSSSRKVINLNADFLDNLTSTQFLRRDNDESNPTKDNNVYAATNFWIDATNVTIADPIIDIGGESRGDVLIGSHSTDRGFTFHYWDTSSKRSFLGWDHSELKFRLLDTVTNSNEVVTGTDAGVLAGNLTLSSQIASTSTSTGTLIVDGGVGISGDVHIQETVTIGNQTEINDTLIIKSDNEDFLIQTTAGVTKFSVDTDTGNTVIEGTLDVQLETEITDNLIVRADNKVFDIQTDAGVSKFTVDTDNGNTTIEGTLDVQLETEITDNLIVTADAKEFIIRTAGQVNKFTVDTDNGNTDIQGTLNVEGDVTLQSNLTVFGTTTTVNSTVVTIDDPIFTLGGDTDPTSDDNKDRGIEFRYYDTQARKGFFGWDENYADANIWNGTGGYRFLYDATNTGEVFSGTDAALIAGNLRLTTNTSSTWKTPTTGTLVVTGGVGISENLNVGGTAHILGNVEIDGTVDIDDNFAVRDGTTDKFTIESSTGNTVIEGTLDVQLETEITDNLIVRADNKIFDVQTDAGVSKFRVNSNTGNTEIQGTVTVQGQTLINDSLIVDEAGREFAIQNGSQVDKFTVQTDSGNTVIQGTLNVVSAVDLDSTLNVDNDATFNENVTIIGSTAPSGVAARYFKIESQTGLTKFEVVSATGNTDISGTLNVDGNGTFNSSLTVAGSDTAATNYFKVTNQSGVDKFVVDSANGNTALEGTLTVESDTDIGNGNVTIAGATGNTVIQGTVNVISAVDLDDTLNVDGAATFQDDVTINADNKTFAIQNNANDNKFTVDTDNGNTFIAGTLEVTNTSQFNNHVTIGTALSPDNLQVHGTTTLEDDVTVNGGVLRVNSTEVTIDDPVIKLFGDTAPGSVHTNDVGIEFNYYDGANRLGFFGWDISVQSYHFLERATNANEVLTGVDAGIIAGSLALTTGTQSTSDTTGTLRVAGGAGITKNLYVGEDLEVQGGDLTTNQTTFNLLQTNATTVNAFGVVTDLNIGNSAGGPAEFTFGNASNVNTLTLVGNGTSGTINYDTNVTTGLVNLFNGVTGTVNLGGSGTTVNVGLITGNATLQVRGAGVNGTATISTNVVGGVVNLLNSVTGTVNVAGAGSLVDFAGDIRVKGGDITTNQTSFNLINTVATTVNAFGAATSIDIGATTGTTSINNNVDIDLDLNVDGGDLTTNATTFNLLNANATTVNAFGDANSIGIGAATGTLTINNALTALQGDLQVRGGDFTTNQTTFNILNTTATTVNAFGDATTINVGDNSGTLTIGNPTIVSTQAGISVFNTVATTVNAFGAATTLNLGAGSGTTTINNNLVVGGDLDVQGTITTINSTTVQVDDKNLELGTIANPTDATADGGGLTLKGATDKTFNWYDASDAWTSSEHLELAVNKSLFINSNNVLSQTTLGTTVVNSSLKNFGLVTQLNVDDMRLDGNTLNVQTTNVDLNIAANGVGVINLNSDIETVYDASFGTLLDNSQVTVLGRLDVDNVAINTSDIFSTPTNGNLNIYADGTGKVIVEQLEILDNSITPSQNNANLELYSDGTGTIELNDSTNVTGDFTVSGTAAINGNVTIGDAAGDAHTVNGTVTFVNAVDMNGTATIDNISFNTRTITATGGSLILDSSVNSVVVNADLRVGDDLRVDDDVILGETDADSLTVNATSTFLAAITSTNITADAIQIGVDADNEISTTAGDLILDSAGGKVHITDNAEVDGNLQVDGNTTLGDVAGDTLTVNAQSTFNANITSTNRANIRNLKIGTDADNEIGTLAGNLILDSTGGTVNVTDNLDVDGDANVDGNLTVVGQIDVDNIRASNNTVESTTGDLVLASAGNITTSEQVDITNTLNVTGQVNADNLRLDGDTLSNTAGNNLDITTTADVDIQGQLQVGSTAFAVGTGVNPSTAEVEASNLAVSGNAVVDGDLTVRDNLIVTTDVSVPAVILSATSKSSAKTTTIASTSNSTPYQIDNDGSTPDTADGVKYTVCVINSSNQRYMSEILMTYDGADMSTASAVNLTEYAVVNPNGLGYGFSADYDAGNGGQIVLSIVGVPASTSVTVKLHKTHLT